VADLFLFIKINEEEIIQQEYENNKSPFKVKDYRSENLFDYSRQTAETARELVNYSKK
jgi:hypothetical protein